jgi:hypothetical protein
MNGIKFFSCEYIVVDYLKKFPVIGKKIIFFRFFRKEKLVEKKNFKEQFPFPFSYDDLLHIVELIFV